MQVITSATPTLSIDADIFRQFPALRVGALIVTSLDRAAASMSAIDVYSAWAASSESLARRGITRENLTTADPIREWRQTFAACAVSPSAHASGVESAARRALAHGGPRTLVPILELCGALAARHLAPLCGHDLSALPSLDLRMRAARASSDWFVPRGALPTDLPLAPSVVVYAAGATVLAWSFNHRDSRQTCVHASTRRAVFFSEAINETQAEAAAAALDELGRVLCERGARAGAPVFAHRGSPRVSLPVDATDTFLVAQNPGGDTTP